jgi:hypothetical protein
VIDDNKNGWDDEPAESVLLALGGVTWNAISLEDRVVSLITEVPGTQWPNKAAISVQITDAKRILIGVVDVPAALTAYHWLGEAEELLAIRNSVFHGIPSIMMNPGPDGKLQHGEDLLVHMPRKGGYVEITLTLERFMEFNERLQRVRSRWRDVSLDLFSALRPDD